MAQLGGDACKSRREGNEMCEREEFFFRKEGGKKRSIYLSFEMSPVKGTGWFPSLQSFHCFF